MLLTFFNKKKENIKITKKNFFFIII